MTCEVAHLPVLLLLPEDLVALAHALVPALHLDRGNKSLKKGLFKRGERSEKLTHPLVVVGHPPVLVLDRVVLQVEDLALLLAVSQPPNGLLDLTDLSSDNSCKIDFTN